MEERTRFINEVTATLLFDSKGDEQKRSVEAVASSREPYTAMSASECVSIASKMKKGIDLVEDLDDDDDELEDDYNFVEGSKVNEVSDIDKLVVEAHNSEVSDKITLTTAQRWCVREMHKEMTKGQMLVLLHGPPGSGKTTTARQLGTELSMVVVFAGTTGTAAAQHKAPTINSLLHLGRTVEDFDSSKQWISADVKNTILNKFGDARILVIDECSMLNPVMLALVDLRLRQCFDSEKVFGGLHIILIGDMFQFPPIGKKLNKPALYQAAVLCSRNRRLPNETYRTGANLFMKFRLLRLKEQKRAGADFAAFLDPLRNSNRPKPITRNWLNKLRTLSSGDIRHDSSWAFTTIATTGNDERLAITRAQVKRFGWFRNEPIVHWVCPVRSEKVGREWVYKDLDIDTSFLTGKFRNLSCYFVRGAKCVLSENLCTTLGFAKGTQGVLDSLVWDPEEGVVPDLSTMPPGVVTTVRQPRFILVKVNDSVIPIGYSNGRFRYKRKEKEKSRFINFRMHAINLLFAVTYHKLQGVTLDKLILAINKHPNPKLRLLLSSLYVGISRVHNLDEVRVLPFNEDDIQYLLSLQYDELLTAWINNYTEDGLWKFDGFSEFEKKMLRQTKMDLGLINDLSDLTISECRNYLSKLDIVSSASKVAGLRSELRDSHIEGQTMLHANNGRLLRVKRFSLFKQFKNLGDCKKLKLGRLRFYAKRLGIANVGRLNKRNVIKALLDVETSLAG